MFMSSKFTILARHRWHVPVILATQEAEVRRMAVQFEATLANSLRPYLEKTHHKNGLVEWLNV
jgi:hypothetical protein